MQSGLSEENPAVYIPPEKSELSVPQEVAGKSGYQEIQSNDNEIEETEAEELEHQLGVGETGDGLTLILCTIHIIICWMKMDSVFTGRSMPMPR